MTTPEKRTNPSLADRFANFYNEEALKLAEDDGELDLVRKALESDGVIDTTSPIAKYLLELGYNAGRRRTLMDVTGIIIASTNTFDTLADIEQQISGTPEHI